MEEESKKTSINIWGCCVSRDSVAFRQNKYVVPRFVQFISPLTVFDGNKIPLSLENFSDYPEVTNFCKRCICLDANKNAAEYTLEERADWLLFDISEIRLSLYVWEKAGAILTKGPKLSRMLGVVNEQLDGEIPSEVNPSAFSEEAVTAAVEKLCDAFLKHFPTERIIFHEFYNVDCYLDEDDVLRDFSESKKAEFKKQNDLIKKAAEICKKKFSGCHIIRMPDKTFADARHRFGLDPLHYTSIYHDYAEKCISLILEGKSSEEEKEQLSVLYELYNEKMLSCCMWARKNGYRQRAHRAEEELTRARSLCAEEEQKLARLQSDCEGLQRTNVHILEENRALEREREELKENVTSLERERAQLAGTVSELQELRVRLERREKQLTEEKNALEETNERLGETMRLQKEELGKKESALSKQRERSRQLQGELNALRGSRSYKIGRLITWLPRKIRGVFGRR